MQEMVDTLPDSGRLSGSRWHSLSGTHSYKAADIRNRGQVTGWQGLIRVDNATYNWLGATSQSTVYVKQTAFEYTSTRSIFTLNVADCVEMKVTFLSSVTPDDFMRSSLPFSYLDVSVSSTDGNSHDIQLYTDISAGAFTYFLY
jgi:hypothetical protein